MQYETDPGRPNTLADNLQRGHRVADEIEQCLMSIDGVLSGCAQSANVSGAAAPSTGLLGHAYSLADRLERIMGAVHILSGTISSAPNVVDYPSDVQAKGRAEALYHAQMQAARVGASIIGRGY